MGLHRAGKKADWQRTDLEEYNAWQRIARHTAGLVTPGNLTSVAGLLLVLYGAYLLLQGRHGAGLLLIIAGRLTDVLDGIVAEKTRTKSPIGEMVDATIDKLAILAVIPALVIEQLLPLAVLVIIILQNGINAILAVIAKTWRVELRPTIEGKIATAAGWAVIGAFGTVAIADQSHGALHNVLAVIAYASMLIFAIYGLRASQNYVRLVFDAKPRDYFKKLTGSSAARPNLQHEFQKVILIINPRSSNARRIEKRAQELGGLFPPTAIATIETTSQPKKLVERLKKELHNSPGFTLIAIGGGDGTANMVVNALMNLRADIKLDLATVPILPLWGGNANDLACMLNGLSSHNTLRGLLARAEIVAVYPFKIVTDSRGRVKTRRYAACYVSFGASAYAASALERPDQEEHLSSQSALGTLIKEFTQVARAILNAPGFDAEQNGQQVKIFEQVFANGSRIAKMERLPVKLHERRFYRAVKSETQPTLMFYLQQLLRGKKFGEITNKSFHFTAKEQAWAQFDGEAMVLPKNTTVHVSHAETPFYALTTRLKPLADQRPQGRMSRRRAGFIKISKPV